MVGGHQNADIDCVILAAGPGSRMLDLLTGGGGPGSSAVNAKCMLSLAGVPLIYYPLKLLQSNGFKSAILTVPDSIKTDVSKVLDKYKLEIKVDIVPIPMSKEWATLDTLRHIQDKLTARDTLLLSCDLITNASLKEVVDFHRSRASGLTVLLNKPVADLKAQVTPGSKTTKYKIERDLIGLSRDSLCLFQAEADVEDRIHISSKLLHSQPNFTIHSNLQDSHLYVINRNSLEEHLLNKGMSTVKGELVPRMVANQFKKKTSFNNNSKDLGISDTNGGVIEERPATLYSLQTSEPRTKCYAMTTDVPTIRVNNIPNFWLAYKLIKGGQLLPQLSAFLTSSKDETANVDEKCHHADTSFGAKCQVSGKTTIKQSAIGASATIGEKLKITNSVIMDGVKVASIVNITDSIICEGASIETGCELTGCIIGRNCNVSSGTILNNQVLLNSDSMMHL